ncbi:MAG: PAS domain-containing protein [Dongiaceae bacterium]
MATNDPAQDSEDSASISPDLSPDPSSESAGTALSTGEAEAARADVINLTSCAVELAPGLRRYIGASPDPRWRQFFDYWLDLATRAGRLPSRQDIDPVQMAPAVIPNLYLVEVVYETARIPLFRFRLMGQEVIEHESTRPGHFLHELGGGYDRSKLEPQYRDCVDRRIWLRRDNLVWDNPAKSFISYDVLLLPLARDGRNVDAMIGLVVYTN